MTFGAFVREKRIAAELSLREFCKIIQTDPSNWSKVERDFMPVPDNRDFLDAIAKLLNVRKGTPDWFTFFDLAAISQQKIPDDVYKDEDVISALPVFFRTMRGDKPSEEDLDRLIGLLRRR